MELAEDFDYLDLMTKYLVLQDYWPSSHALFLALGAH